MTMRGPCDKCGRDRGTVLKRVHITDTWDQMICPGCVAEVVAAGGIPPDVEADLDSGGSRCARCGGRHMLTVRAVSVGDVEVRQMLCIRCRKTADRENTLAAERSA